MPDRQVTWYAATLSAIIISVAAGIGSKEQPKTETLKLYKLDVPKWADLRSSVTLNCQYELGTFALYSVKWYKDDNEFFRYSPELEPPMKVFVLEGISVNMNKSSSTQVTLYPLSRKSEGNYKCEVSVDASNFPTVVEDANMTIIALPDDIPRIEGLRQFYSEGDFLEANCTAVMAFPAARVTWYINNAEVDNYLVERYPLGVSEGPFYNSTVGIRFPLTKEWMESNKNKQMDIMCTAKVANAQELINKTNVLLRHDSDQTLSQKRQIFSNNGVTNTNRWAVLLIAFAFHYFEAHHN